MNLLLLLVSIFFTLPSWNAIQDGCGDGQIPLHDLRWVRLYKDSTLVRQKQVSGREGMPDSLGYPGSGRWEVATADSAGNESCWALFAPVTAVAPPDELPLYQGTFDVAGRRVQDISSGVYFKRGKKVTKIK